MTVTVDPRSGEPIYEQVRRQIAAQIACGEVAADTLLPSIRTLAKALGVSVVTTKRAYDELEAAGFVYTVPAKGVFAAKTDRGVLRAQTAEKLRGCLENAVKQAKENAMSEQDLQRMLSKVWDAAEKGWIEP